MSSAAAGSVPAGLVSIVLPVYNGERHLDQAVESIRRQTVPNWELVIVDDGSADRSREIALRHAAADPRVRVIAQPNRKLPAALSAGFRAARGGYFTWTSADNRLLPDFLARLVRELEAHPGWDMVTADMRMIDGSGAPLRGSDCIKPFQDPADTSVVHYPDDFAIMERQVCNVVGGAFLYRARCGRMLGDYDDAYFTAEDYEYWLRLREFFALRHASFRDPIYEYRFHDASLSARSGELRTVELSERLLRHHRQRQAGYQAKLPCAIRSAPAENQRDPAVLEAALREAGAAPDGRPPSSVTPGRIILEAEHPLATRPFSATIRWRGDREEQPPVAADGSCVITIDPGERDWGAPTHDHFTARDLAAAARVFVQRARVELGRDLPLPA